MSALSELFPYYEDELSHLKHLASAFAAKYEGAAKHLKMEGDVIADPHVARLLEGCAFLAARIHKRLDDDFPEITDALLGIAYPHLVRPIPSMSIVQFQLDPEDTQVTTVQPIKRHTQILATTLVDGVQCRFRTCYPVQLAPLTVADASLERAEDTAFKTSGDQPVASLRIGLKVHGAETVGSLGLSSLRFFIDAEGSDGYTLYELIQNSATRVTLRDQNGNSTSLPPSCIRPVGFETDDGLFDYDARSFLGYRLVHEYFSFPEKFLFFEITGLQNATAGLGTQVDIVIALSDTGRRERLPRVSAQTFKLGCTPIVNLFRWGAKPIALRHRRAEYEIQLDRWQSDAIEIYSVDSVNRLSQEGANTQVLPLPPFFGLKHWATDNGHGQFWYAVRRPTTLDESGMQSVFIAFVDAAMNPATSDRDTISLAVTCTNADVPHHLLPFGGAGDLGRPENPDSPTHPQPRRGDFTLDEPSVAKRIRLLRRPTRTLRPPLRDAARWRLISHLALNHMSIVASGREAFMELLSLYNYSENPVIKKQVRGISELKCRPSVAPMTTLGRRSYVQGLEIDVWFEEDAYAGGGVYLFAAVLERFLALYVTTNSFTKLTAHLRQPEKELAKWRPRAGNAILA